LGSRDSAGRLLNPQHEVVGGQHAGVSLIGGSPDKLAAFLKSETAKWAVVAKNADLVAR
jgi:hypothetical protein